MKQRKFLGFMVFFYAMWGYGQVYNPAVPSTQPADYILTPAPSHSPRINGATVFGARPGNPFLYNVSATGDRPMTFKAENLPEGLSIDASTGRISGSVAKSGEYILRLTASNAQGSTSCGFDIKIGDTIGLTPSLGWNSWNCWAGFVDQDKVLRSAKAMVASGLNQHGWSYINIDDTWQGARTGADHALQANEKFPDMKGLCDQIHAMGLKAGIYSTPWMQSYAGFAGGSADTPDGAWQKAQGRQGQKTGQVSFAAADAKQWAAWGFDYLKYDWNPNRKPEVRAMADALHASGRDIVYSLSNAAPFATAGEYNATANSWRTTGDIRDTWQSMSQIGFNQANWSPFSQPGHFNDPDMLVVGYVGWSANLHLSHLTADEQYTHISLWSLLSAPMLIGCDLDRLDPFTLNLLGNDEVLAVDQDAECAPVSELATHGFIRIFTKQLADGSQAVGMFNVGPEAEAAMLPVPGNSTIRDLWRQKDIGTFSNAFQAMVPSHGVVMVKVSH